MARTGRASLVALAALLLVGCGVPIPPEVPDTSTPQPGGAGDGSGQAVDRLVPVDGGSEVLAGALGDLATRIGAARDLLLAGDGDGAVGVLLGVPGGGDAPGVMPAIEPDRAGAGSDDLVTVLVTLAGDVGGERSRLVIELVRDPMLGDLGAWQRDPIGVIAQVQRIATEAAGSLGQDGVAVPASDGATLDAALLELPGELTRALGYAFVVAATDDAALSAHAAERGAGRLGVVLVALELAVEQLGVAR